MQNRQKKEPQSLWRDLAREAAKYIVTGLIGASAVLLYTCYRRLPGRSLTISPGGARIPTTVANILMGVIDYGMDIQEAVNALRIILRLGVQNVLRI